MTPQPELVFIVLFVIQLAFWSLPAAAISIDDDGKIPWVEAIMINLVLSAVTTMLAVFAWLLVDCAQRYMTDPAAIRGAVMTL